MSSYRETAGLLKLMAHPVRLQILDILRRDAECVCHLSAALGKPQPYVSQQLAILRNAGLIADEKDGINVFYRLSDPRAAEQMAAAFGETTSDSAVGHIRLRECPCPKCAPGSRQS